MADYNHSSENQAGECKPLMDACTPFVYRHNAFRITGLLADASVRDIKRRIDDLKHAEEMGDADEEHSHAFALSPPPSLELIREAALKLQDPEQRIVQEFFWFWPLDWNDAKRDSALRALGNGDKSLPQKIWNEQILEDHIDQSIVSKHNLAVLYQMTALEGELLGLEKTLTEKSLERVEKYWRTSFVWWEELADSEPFWSLISARIRMLDDPRLTTGFARRMRATLPEALDKINALLALRYVENGNLPLARKHIAFMQETHQGLDDVPNTLAIVTHPLITRIRDAVDHANQVAERSPIDAADAAEELFETTRQPIDIIRSILPQNDHTRIDICDAVAEAGLTCSNAFLREERDFSRFLAILGIAEGIAESLDSKLKITDTAALANGVVMLELILAACEQAVTDVQRHPEGALRVANRLLAQLEETRAKINSSRVSLEIRSRANNEIAAVIMHCAIIYGNKTEQWNPCVEYLEKSRHIATDRDLIAHITQNLDTARRNANAQSLANYRAWQQAPAQSNKGWLIAIMIFVAIAVLYGLAQDNSSSSRPSNQSRPRSTYGTQPYNRGSLAREIENGKARAKQIETEIESMDNRIEEMEREMNSYQLSGRTNDYNGLVPTFNSLVKKRNSVYEEYSRLIDDVNAKVNRYNSGAR
jgi:hypothetical protein